MTTPDSITVKETSATKHKGFTLIEVLIAIVVVGILAAVVIIGISSLTKEGGSAACTASADATKAAAVVYFSKNNTYPTTFDQMTSAVPSMLDLGSVTVDGTGKIATKGTQWTLTMSGGGATSPGLACS